MKAQVYENGVFGKGGVSFICTFVHVDGER